MYITSGTSTKYICIKCRNKIEKDDLEEIFHQQLNDYIISEDSFSQFINTSLNIIIEKENQLNILSKEAQKIQIKLDNLIELHTNEELASDGFKYHYNPPYEQLKQINS